MPRQQQLKNVVAASSSETEFYALTKSASSGAVCMTAAMAMVVKPVDAALSKAMASRRGVERPSRECQGAKTPCRSRHETLGSGGNARIHEKSRLPEDGRTFEVIVEGREDLIQRPFWNTKRKVENIVKGSRASCSDQRFPDTLSLRTASVRLETNRRNQIHRTNGPA